MLYITWIGLDLTEQHHFRQMGAGTKAARAALGTDMVLRWYLSATIIDFGSEKHCAPISGDNDGCVLLYRS